MQVDRAAPIPVPVQIRIPRRNIAEACPTAAVHISANIHSAHQRLSKHTKFQLARPESLRGVLHEAFCEVTCRIRWVNGTHMGGATIALTLNTADHVKIGRAHV